MTKIEAEKKLNELEVQGLGFCPLIKNNCTKTCLCYRHGIIINNGNNDYYIKTPSCIYEPFENIPKTVMQ